MAKPRNNPPPTNEQIMEGWDDMINELVELNNQGKSWHQMAIEAEVAPSTLLRFIDRVGKRGPHLLTARKIAAYVGFELCYVRSHSNARLTIVK